MDIGFETYQRFLDGDEKALDDLITIYRTPLTAFINGFVKDADTAESLMIDVFVELVRSKGAFRGNSNLKTYLFAIGRNKALRHLKQRKNYDFVSLDEVENYILSDRPLEEEVSGKMQKEAIRNAMSALLPAYKEVLYLLYFEEMSYEQAGKVLHKSVKQITNLAYRAKQALKKIITEKECLE